MIELLLGGLRRFGVLLAVIALGGLLATTASADVSPISYDFGVL